MGQLGKEPAMFHSAVASVVVLAQCFALLPVRGITAPYPDQLRFRWSSLRVLYVVVVFLVLFLMALFCCVSLMERGRYFQDAQCFIFFGIALATYALFLNLARSWPHFILQWTALEEAQKCYGTPRYLRLKIRVLTAVLLLGAAVEHTLNEYNNMQLAAQNSTGSVFKNYMVRSHAHLFSYIKYSDTTAVVATFASTLATFSWNFMDLFLSIISIALTERFRLLNQHLLAYRGKMLPELFWKQIREHYTSLAYLTETLNLSISRLVLLSFGSNMFFICLQLFNSLNRLPTWHQRVYFYWSFGFLILRTITMSLSVAGIHDESRLPQSVLYAVPTEGYNVEVSRFLHLVTTNEVAFTGLNFFSVTRKMLLTMAGTIVTYEIIQVQINHIDP